MLFNKENMIGESFKHLLRSVCIIVHRIIVKNIQYKKDSNF
jgi:hypothetical protein